MKYSSVVSGSAADLSAKKRRYSSTAVGFPIRNDQKPYSQGISEGFPTCIGARRVRIYVRQRPLYEYQSYEVLHSASTRSTYLPLFASSTPSRVQNLPVSRPCLRHVSVLNRPCDLPVTTNPHSEHERTWSLRMQTKPARWAGKITYQPRILDQAQSTQLALLANRLPEHHHTTPSRLAHQDRIINQAQSTLLALLADRLPDHHHTTPSRPTLLRLMLCLGSPTVDQTNATRCRQESIGIVSGFTWESLEDVPHSFSTRYALIMESLCTMHNST